MKVIFDNSQKYIHHYMQIRLLGEALSQDTIGHRWLPLLSYAFPHLQHQCFAQLVHFICMQPSALSVTNPQWGHYFAYYLATNLRNAGSTALSQSILGCQGLPHLKHTSASHLSHFAGIVLVIVYLANYWRGRVILSEVRAGLLTVPSQPAFGQNFRSGSAATSLFLRILIHRFRTSSVISKARISEVF